MNRDAEIAQINRELDILLARYATYERSARMLRVAFNAMAVVIVILILVALFKILIADVLMGSFLVVMAVIIGPLLWHLCRFEQDGMRPVDVASMQISPFSMSPLIPFMAFRRLSDARIIERQIAEREQRLREIAQSQP